MIVKKLYKIILTEYFLHFALISLSLLTVVIIFDILDFLDELLLLKPHEIIKFLIYRIPYCFSYISLFSIVVAAISSLTALAQRFELIAIYFSGVSTKKVAASIAFLIFIFSLISFINNSFFAPLYYKKSLVLTHKHPDEDELALTDLALKKENSFLFIEKIENNGRKIKKATKITLNSKGLIENIYLIPEAVKTVDGWHTEIGYKFNEKSEREMFNGKIEIDINEAAINLAIKPSLLSFNEIIHIIEFGKHHNINVTKYSHAISRKVLAIFSAVLIFILFFKPATERLDEKSRINLLIKLTAFLFFYNIIEANLYNFSIAHQFNSTVPLITIISFLLLLKAIKLDRLF